MRDSVRHSDRDENPLAKKRRKALSRDALHDERQQRVPAVAVTIALAGAEVGCVMRLEEMKHIRVMKLCRCTTRHHVFVVDDSRSVREQLLNGDWIG